MIMESFQVKNSRQKGRFGEETAKKYLEAKGYSYIAGNFHIQGGEIDIIMKKNDIIVFVEVKLRTGMQFGSGTEALNRNKKHKLLRTIYVYLSQHRGIKCWQLDLVNILYDQTGHRAFIQHFANILEL